MCRWPSSRASNTCRETAINYFEHHIGDYDQATAHLTACEDGIYSRLIRWYMASESPLPADLKLIQRRVRAHSRDERAAVQTILGEFFELCSDGYHQHRCDEEIARFKDKQAKAKRSAEARWSGHRTQSEGNADAMRSDMRTHSEGNAPRARPQTPDTKPKTFPVPDGTDGSAAPTPRKKPSPDPVKDELWRLGRGLLETQGESRETAGSFLGKLVKDHGQRRVLDAVREADSLRPAEAKAWLTARCQERSGGGMSKQAQLEERNRLVAEAWLPPELRNAAG